MLRLLLLISLLSIYERMNVFALVEVCTLKDSMFSNDYISFKSKIFHLFIFEFSLLSDLGLLVGEFLKPRSTFQPALILFLVGLVLFFNTEGQCIEKYIHYSLRWFFQRRLITLRIQNIN